MTLLKRSLSALGRVVIVAAIAIAFSLGLILTIYLSLRSAEVKVPDVVGKDRMAGESALTDAGLNLRQRATRYSADEKPNTILDQSPRAGEVIKVGQTVAVVLSRADAKEGESSVSVASANKSKESKPEEGKNEGAAKNQNDDRNRERPGKNANTRNSNNKNANNSNNANRGNANSNVNNRNSDARSATNRTASVNRNADAGNRNANASGNRNAADSNVNMRAPAVSPTPVNRNARAPQ